MQLTNASSTTDLPQQNIWDCLTVLFLSICILAGGPINISVCRRLYRRVSVSASRSLLLKLQLNISDLLVLFVFALSKLIWHVVFDWYGSWWLCKAVKFGHELSFQISSAILASIGIDRLLSILQPFTPFAVAKRRAIVLIVLSWLYATVFSLPQVFSFTVLINPRTGRPQCNSWRHLLNESHRYGQNERLSG